MPKWKPTSSSFQLEVAKMNGPFLLGINVMATYVVFPVL